MIYHCYFCGNKLRGTEPYWYSCDYHNGITVQFNNVYNKYLLEIWFSIKLNNLNYNRLDVGSCGRDDFKVKYFLNNKIHFIPNFSLATQSPEQSIDYIKKYILFS